MQRTTPKTTTARASTLTRRKLVDITLIKQQPSKNGQSEQETKGNYGQESTDGILRGGNLTSANLTSASIYAEAVPEGMQLVTKTDDADGGG